MAANNCCLCFPTRVGSNPCGTTTSSGCQDNCLYFPDLLIPAVNSVGPCNEVGFIPFADVEISSDVCGDEDLVYTWLSNTSNVKDVIVTSEGITFTSNSLVAGDSFIAKITFAVACGDLATIVEVTVILQNLCTGQICPTGQICSRCTGLCVDAESDLESSDEVEPTANPSGFTS